MSTQLYDAITTSITDQTITEYITDIIIHHVKNQPNNNTKIKELNTKKEEITAQITQLQEELQEINDEIRSQKILEYKNIMQKKQDKIEEMQKSEQVYDSIRASDLLRDVI
jgi:esterase/lipase